MRVGEVSEQAVETGEATSDPLAEPRFHSGAQATRLFRYSGSQLRGLGVTEEPLVSHIIINYKSTKN